MDECYVFSKSHVPSDTESISERIASQTLCILDRSHMCISNADVGWNYCCNAWGNTVWHFPCNYAFCESESVMRAGQSHFAI